MTSLLTKPHAIKILLGLTAVSSVVCATLGLGYVSARGGLLAEKARHQATALKLGGELALARTEISLLQNDRTEQGRIIAGLQAQARQAQEILAEERQAAIDRSAIVAAAKSRPANPKEIVDAKTSKKIIRHLNAALRRR